MLINIIFLNLRNYLTILSTSKLHVLFLTSWYPSRVFPTLGDFIQRHAEALHVIHKVSVIHVISDPNLENTIEFDTQEINGINTYIAYIPTNISLFKKFILQFKAYLFLINKIGKFDLVHLNKLYPSGMIALYLKFFKQKKYLITEHWSGYQTANNFSIGFFEKSISKIITRNASFVCPVSKNLGLEMQNFGLKGNYLSIPNVVDTNLFQPIQTSNDNLQLIHISSMDDSIKNITGIINVLDEFNKENSNFICYFIGGKKDKFTTQLAKLELTENQIQFIEHIPQKDMVAYLQKADTFILFSNYENLPCVILESFSCGVPVIATNVGGISEYFPENFGQLISVNNEIELLNALKNIKKPNIEQKNQMHQYAIDNFSRENIAHKFDHLYRQML